MAKSIPKSSTFWNTIPKIAEIKNTFGRIYTSNLKKEDKKMKDANDGESMIRDDLGDVFQMTTSDGTRLAFEVAARVKLDGQEYAIMLPLFDFEGKQSNSVFIFKVDIIDGRPDFSIVPDEKTAMAVVDEFARLHDEKNNKDDK